MAGGGTDFKDYYMKSYGTVISTAIDKYLYVTVTKRFDGKIHLRYSQIEEVDDVNELQHEIAKQCMKVTGVTSGVEIVTISDIPTKGSGLGSSSALTVGLLNALLTYKGMILSPEKLAEMACMIEIRMLKSPIGKQDQYITALGGFCRFCFFNDDTVSFENFNNGFGVDGIKLIEKELLLFYSGKTRSANDILIEHKNSITSKRKHLDRLVELSNELYGWLYNHSYGIHPSIVLNESWEIKKKMSEKCTSVELESIIKRILSVGKDIGTKFVGAGGGGFILVYCPIELQQKLREELKDLHELPFKFSKTGTEVIHNDGIYE